MAGNGNHESNETRTQSGEPLLQELSDECYLVACPERRLPFFYLLNMVKNGYLAQTTAPDHVFAQMNNTTTWQERLSLFGMQTLGFLNPTLNAVGSIIEIIANVLIANGGLLRTIFRLLCSALFLFKKGPLVVPDQDSAEYLSITGMTDPRKTLLVMDTSSDTNSSHTESADNADNNASQDIFPGPGNGDRRIVDVMVMAAKFAYENEALIREVVTNEWKMNFVGLYNCWNEYQQRFDKEVFVFTDKAQDANAVVVAWRGTDPFSALDWSTDFDFSWYDLHGGVGKVHLGFLEALGLGDRHDMQTFFNMQKNARILKKQKKCSPATEPIETLPAPAASGLPQDIIETPEKILAYDYVTQVVKELLEKNPNAKLYITGHSLGGAVALLFTGMLYYFGELAVTKRIAALYTVGQPRVGDEQFGKFMLETLTVERYFRVVYCNDLIPRVPFDDKLFNFKHWGLCYYFSSMYEEQTLKEEPNPNYFKISDFLSIHVNAVWELLNSFFISYKYGPEYKESTASFLYRIFALFFPGLGDHSLVNYNNAVRLGKPMPLIAKLSD